MKKICISIGLMLAIVACGSKSASPDKKSSDDVPGTPGSPSADGGVSSNGNPSAPSSDGNSNTSTPGADAGPHAPSNQKECIAVCEAKHPVAATDNKSLDSTCILGGACVAVCNDLGTPGKNFPPTQDADAAAPVDCPIGDGVDPIMTPSAACSTCIAGTPACCALWIKIFGSADGRDLNACANACFSQFKN